MLYPRFMLDYIMQECRTQKVKPFKIIGYSTMPQIDKEYPNSLEMKQLSFNFVTFLFFTLVFMVKKVAFYVRNKIRGQSWSMWATFEPLMGEKVVVFTFPQFQARSHLRDPNIYKFVGSSLDETLHFNGINDQFEISVELRKLLDQQNADYDLVYVSLGTLFNFEKNISVYVTILDALKAVSAKRRVKVVMATGDKCFEKLVIYIYLSISKVKMRKQFK